MKIVLHYAESKLNEAIGNTKVKVDSKIIELVLNFTKSVLNQALSKINTLLRLEI
jgi:hypothetical protein